MTSVVDTSVKHFSSSMLNAPVLNGVAGSLISVLDACLKDGFDLKTATSLVVAAGVATLTFTGTHSATQDSVILVAGSSVTALNGEQKITSVGTNIVKFATAAADGTATGTITFKMAPAGWLKPFSGTNLAAYKSADVTATGCLLRVDDTGANVARVIGYETMSAISTGTGPFPSTAQISGGGYWAKSVVASAVAINWTLFCDSKYLILYVAPNSGALAANVQGFTRAFGDPIALRPSGDAFACALSYSTNTTPQSQFDGSLDNGTVATQAMPRSYTGLGTSSLHVSVPYTGLGSSFSGGDTTLGAFPSIIDGSLRVSRKYFATAAVNAPPRADVPGYYWVPQSSAFDIIRWGDKIAGTGTLTGRNLFALSPSNANVTSTPIPSNTGLALVDITGPWR